MESDALSAAFRETAETAGRSADELATEASKAFSDAGGGIAEAWRDLKAVIETNDFDLRDFFSKTKDGADGLKDKLSEVAGLFKTAFEGVFDAILDKSKSLSDVLLQLGRDLMKIVLKAQVYGLLGKLMPGTFGEKGAIPLSKFASGGVVSRPTVFPMASGAGLMGEAGPEAILPLTRTRGGDLGVKAQGGGGVVVQIINQSGAQVTQQSSQAADGTRLERFLIQSVGAGVASGRLDGAMASRFGALPTKIAR